MVLENVECGQAGVRSAILSGGEPSNVRVVGGGGDGGCGVCELGWCGSGRAGRVGE